jgi:hypothetical protein
VPSKTILQYWVVSPVVHFPRWGGQDTAPSDGQAVFGTVEEEQTPISLDRDLGLR